MAKKIWGNTLNKKIVITITAAICLGISIYLPLKNDIPDAAIAPKSTAKNPLSQTQSQQHESSQKSIDLDVKNNLPSALPAEQVSEQSSLSPITAPAYLPSIASDTSNAASYQGDLTDHQTYKAFHEERENQLEHRFIIAAKKKVINLEELLAKGRRQNLPQTQLQVAIDKIAALKKVQKELLNKQ